MSSTDKGGLSFSDTFILNVKSNNTPPTNIFLSENRIDENKPIETYIGTFSAKDTNIDETFSYSFTNGVGDQNNNQFIIKENNLLSSETFDYETKSNYSVRVLVADNDGLTFERDFEIIVNNVNETPTAISLINNSLDENEELNLEIGVFNTEDPDFNDGHAYSLVSGNGDTYNSSFIITDNRLLSNDQFNFETKSSYSIRVQTEDSGGLSYQKNFEISIVDVNEAPTDILLGKNTIDENTPSGKQIGEFSSLDEDFNDSHNYSLVSGEGDDNNSSFTISDNQLLSNEEFNFEVKSNYPIRVQTQDKGGLSYSKKFLIQVNNVNDPPTEITLSNNRIDENLDPFTFIGTFATTDEDQNDSHTYEISQSEIANSFVVEEDQLLSDMAFNYEEKNQYNISIKSIDLGNDFVVQEFTVFITDVDEEILIPNAITPNSDGSNDYFVIPNIEKYTDANLDVYNRKGKLVFTQQQYGVANNWWDGNTTNGKALPSGTYFIVLKLDDGNIYKGTVYLKRN